MKKILIFLLSIILIPTNIFAISTADAKEGIDKNHLTNLIVDYKYDDLIFDGYKTYLYYIADIDKNLQFKLSDSLPNDFKSIKINGIDSNEKWDSLRETIDSYIIANNVEATYTGIINKNKTSFNNIKQGLYFVKTENINSEDFKLDFSSTLVTLPYLNDTGFWNYDVTIYSKASKIIYKENYSVTKVWSSKPAVSMIDVLIYRDGELYDSVVLSKSNNWTYSWSVFDGIASKWNVVEKDITKDYTVDIKNNNGDFIITNTLNPKTGDSINNYIFIAGISLLSFIILLVILKNKSKKNN